MPTQPYWGLLFHICYIQVRIASKLIGTMFIRTNAANEPKISSPSGLPPNVILILCITFPIIVVLAMVMGVVHLILKRHRRKLQAKKGMQGGTHQQLPTARLPSVTVVPNAPTTPSPNGTPLTQSWTQPVPLHTPNQPMPVQSLNFSRPHHTVGHAHIRNMNQHAPLPRPHNTIGHEPMRNVASQPHPPMQTYDSASRRTIYWG